MLKKIISILMITALPMGFAATAFSAQDADAAKSDKAVKQEQVEKAEKCTVTKIEGAQVDLQKDNDEQIAMNIKDQKTLQDLKVGDRVMVKNGNIIKEKEE